RKTANRVVTIKTVRSVEPVTKRMKRRIVESLGEVTGVRGVMSGARMIRDHVRCVGSDRDWSREIDLLPPRRRFVRERRSRKQSTNVRPETANVDAGVLKT